MLHSTRDPFWSKIYGALLLLLIVGLIIFVKTDNSILLLGSVLAILAIGIVGLNTDHQADRRRRRESALIPSPPPQLDLPEPPSEFRRSQAEANNAAWITNDFSEPPAIGDKPHE